MKTRGKAPSEGTQMVARGMRIGKAAEALGTTVHQLRYWDESGQLPAQRVGKGQDRWYPNEVVEKARAMLLSGELNTALGPSRKEYLPLAGYAVRTQDKQSGKPMILALFEGWRDAATWRDAHAPEADLVQVEATIFLHE